MSSPFMRMDFLECSLIHTWTPERLIAGLKIKTPGDVINMINIDNYGRRKESQDLSNQYYVNLAKKRRIVIVQVPTKWSPPL